MRKQIVDLPEYFHFLPALSYLYVLQSSGYRPVDWFHELSQI